MANKCRYFTNTWQDPTMLKNNKCILTSCELENMEKKSIAGFIMQIQRCGAGLYFQFLGLVCLIQIQWKFFWHFKKLSTLSCIVFFRCIMK